MMAAGLKRDVSSGTARLRAGLPERDDLCVIELVVNMKAFADYLFALHQHATHTRVGRGQADRFLRQLQATLHPVCVGM